MFNTYTTVENSNHIQPRVTTILACKENLMAATWHMPISKSPFRYAVAVREENYTHSLLKSHGAFSLNFLSFDSREAVDMTGWLHGNVEDKLSHSNLKVEGKDEMGNVLISTSDFIYECRVCDTYRNGDHTIFITDVSKIHVNEKQSHSPLLFLGKGTYTTIKPPLRIIKSN